jgi:hypothetical protein
MPPRRNQLTVREAATLLDTSSAEICRLLSIGRLVGNKRKQPGRPGKAHWLVNPRSVGKEKRHRLERAAEIARRSRASVRAAAKSAN